jgi:hypothetical protein
MPGFFIGIAPGRGNERFPPVWSDKAGVLSLQTAGNGTAQHLFGSYADELAARNWAGNLRALSGSQPEVVQNIQSQRAGVTWVFGRDGALTAHTSDGRWLGNCSVPLAAARAMLAKLDVTGVIACFLRPEHAAHIVAAMEKLLPEQGLIAVVPDDWSLRLCLACADFSDAIDARRLWFVHGDRWSERLDELFEKQPGLPTPSQFIRTPLLDEAAMQQLIAPAQQVFARHNAARSEHVGRLVSRARPVVSDRQRWCIVGSSRFRLWNDAGAVLADAVGSEGCARFDPGDPSSSSPLALAQLIDASDAIVSTNMGRANLPAVAPADVPWVTWVTNGCVPQRVEKAAGDAVILADARWTQRAEQSGWPSDRIFVAGWPALSATADATPALALIADTCPSLATPASDALPLSSHRLLWEHIRAEIEADPFAIASGMQAYFAKRTRKFAISPETLDRAKFFAQLIIPAYQQSIARLLRAAAIPLHLHGDGWQRIDEFRSIARGPIRSQGELLQAIGRSAALIHPIPSDDAHPLDAAPRLLIRPAGMRRESLIYCAQAAIIDLPLPAAPPLPPISAEIIRNVVKI